MGATETSCSISVRVALHEQQMVDLDGRKRSQKRVPGVAARIVIGTDATD